MSVESEASLARLALGLLFGGRVYYIWYRIVSTLSLSFEGEGRKDAHGIA